MVIKLFVAGSCIHCPEAKRRVTEICNKNELGCEIIDVLDKSKNVPNVPAVPIVSVNGSLFYIPKDNKSLERILKG